MDPTGHPADNGRSVAPQVQPEPDHVGDAGLAALRARGSHQFDPSRFRYLEALALRARLHHGALRTMLDWRLAEAVTAYEALFDAARSELDMVIPALTQKYPQAAQQLRRLHYGGDLRAVRLLASRLARQPHSGPLAELLLHIDGQSTSRGPVGDKALDAATPSDSAPMVELKTVQRFRDTWSRLRVGDQLARSQAKIPENPGPLNSHLLVLRSLRRMQGTSPAYLAHFMAHVDALVWLDQAVLRGPATAGKTAVQGGSKRKVRVAAAKSG
jgi:hypothetical protein